MYSSVICCYFFFQEKCRKLFILESKTTKNYLLSIKSVYRLIIKKIFLLLNFFFFNFAVEKKILLFEIIIYIQK